MDKSEIDQFAGQFNDDEKISDRDPIIQVIGVGGGGSNAINHMCHVK